MSISFPLNAPITNIGKNIPPGNEVEYENIVNKNLKINKNNKILLLSLISNKLSIRLCPPPEIFGIYDITSKRY